MVFNRGDIIYEGIVGLIGIFFVVLVRVKGYKCYICMFFDVVIEKFEFFYYLGVMVECVIFVFIMDLKYFVNFVC